MANNNLGHDVKLTEHELAVCQICGGGEAELQVPCRLRLYLKQLTKHLEGLCEPGAAAQNAVIRRMIDVIERGDWFDGKNTPPLEKYLCEVYDEGNEGTTTLAREFKLEAPSDDIARVVALAIDGGYGPSDSPQPWKSMVELAKMHVTATRIPSAASPG